MFPNRSVIALARDYDEPTPAPSAAAHQSVKHMNALVWVLLAIVSGLVYELLFKRFVLPLVWGLARRPLGRLGRISPVAQKRIVGGIATAIALSALVFYMVSFSQVPHYDPTVGSQESLIRNIGIWMERRLFIHREARYFFLVMIIIIGIGALGSWIEARIDDTSERATSSKPIAERLRNVYRSFNRWAYGSDRPLTGV